MFSQSSTCHLVAGLSNPFIQDETCEEFLSTLSHEYIRDSDADPRRVLELISLEKGLVEVCCSK